MERLVYIPRALSRFLPESSARRIVVITGARQTGKTTLVQERFGDLNYINLDAPENREALRGTATMSWGNTIGNVAIDEAQKEPSVFEKVKYAFDKRDITFTILTGSSQILLLRKIRESLAGRAFFYELWPLMQSELATKLATKLAGEFSMDVPTDVPTFSTDILSHDEMSRPAPPLLDGFFSPGTAGDILSKLPEVLFGDQERVCREVESHILRWGGMPALLELRDEDRWKWLKNYEYTYLERDLADLARLDDLMPFRKFQRLSALRSGQLLNYSELAGDAAISVDTARRYLEYLRISYQTALLQPFYRNLTSSLVKTPKLFWTDVGIWRQMTGLKSGITGQIYETMVIGEIVKWMKTAQREGELYFYRTRSGMEIDLLLETSAGILGMEVKSRSNVSQKDFRSMQRVAEALGSKWRGGLVIYTGDRIAKVGTPDIWAIPSKRLFHPV